MVDFKPGISARFERHDGWHRAGSGAWFDAIEMTVLNDPNARQAAIVTGDVDAVTDVDLKTADMLARAPGRHSRRRAVGHAYHHANVLRRGPI